MKTVLIYAGLALLVFIINFLIYIVSFNALATPFLHEEQRLDSALLMVKTTLPAYVVSSVVISFVFYLVAKFLRKKD